MTGAKRRRRMEQLMLEAEGYPDRWFWLSFADPSRPRGSQFLGVSIVKARTYFEATMRAHALGINPGGEVLGYDYKELWGAPEPPEVHRHRLMSRLELVEAGYEEAAEPAQGRPN